jgi:hypothetical protein
MPPAQDKMRSAARTIDTPGASVNLQVRHDQWRNRLAIEQQNRSVTCSGTGLVNQALPFGGKLAKIWDRPFVTRLLLSCGILTNIVQCKVVELHFVPVGGD